MDGRIVQLIVAAANPACRRLNCHGRGVWFQSYVENMGPTGRYWPQDFWEEDLCECVRFNDPLDGDEVLLALDNDNGPPTYNLVHWGCLFCELIRRDEKQAGDAEARFYAVDDIAGRVENLMDEDKVLRGLADEIRRLA